MDLKKNRKKWRRLLNEHKDSELTIKRFCDINNVKIHQFQYYRNKFREEDNLIDHSSNFIEVVKPNVILDDKITLSLNGIDVSINENNLIKLLQSVKQLD